MDRRKFLKMALGGASMLAYAGLFKNNLAMAEGTMVEHLNVTDEEWKKRLDAQQYDVLRHEGTERAFTSPLNSEKHAGMFVCSGCGLELFPSKFKFDSGTGWPSFFDSIPGHIETKTDSSLFMQRTEYHCARCGGHQGHVFNDGPKPTGLRYCNNGVSLKFVPEKA